MPRRYLYKCLIGGIPANTLYHYLHANGTLKETGQRILDA